MGFSPAQIHEIRSGRASFDTKLDAWRASSVRSPSIAAWRAGSRRCLLHRRLDKENLIDAIVIIGDKTVTNYLMPPRACR